MGSDNKLPDSSVPSNGSSASGSNADLATLLGAMNLPKEELEVFSGVPARYHRFIMSLELKVQDTGIDDKYKLTRLLQYTAGTATEAINGCILIGGPADYKQATLTVGMTPACLNARSTAPVMFLISLLIVT